MHVVDVNGYDGIRGSIGVDMNIWVGIGVGWRVVSIVDRRDRRVNKSGWEWT